MPSFFYRGIYVMFDDSYQAYVWECPITGEESQTLFNTTEEAKSDIDCCHKDGLFTRAMTRAGLPPAIVGALRAR